MNAAIHELIRAIGLPLTLKLVERFGGVRIYLPLPEHLDETNPIVKTIGLAPTRKLAELWPQDRPYLPRAVAWVRRERDRELRRDLETMSFSQAALKYHLTERQVYAINAAGGDDAANEVERSSAKQAGLF